MRSVTLKTKKIEIILFTFFLIGGLSLNSSGQVSVYQYRQVPDDKIEAFIYRETTYWSKVAQNAVNKGNMSFWAVLQKVGGMDDPNSSNFLFINTFRNIDSSEGMWDPSSAFPGVPMSDMETYSMSKVTGTIFTHPVDWEQSSKAKPTDYNFVLFNYQNSSNPDSSIALETQYWKPFIKSAMEKDQTKQVAWGNSVILAPTGDNVKFTNVSYDLYPTLQQALMPDWATDIQFPSEGLQALGKLETTPRGRVIYRVVKVISK
jgi:hypothetical protein